MKIFISWSGDKSRLFAEALKPWLEQVMPGTDVWLSSEDIDKGTIWFTEILNELERCNCGVICITRENYLAPWIHFEAGGMIKGLGKSRVATILLDLDYGELRQPLNQFNGLRPNRIGVFHLVKSFNKLAERPIKEHVLERTFEKFWGELEEFYDEVFPDPQGSLKNNKKPLHIVPDVDASLPALEVAARSDDSSSSEKVVEKSGKKAKKKKVQEASSASEGKKDQMFLFPVEDIRFKF